MYYATQLNNLKLSVSAVFKVETYRKVIEKK